jgi:hypothetical protein
MTLRTANFVKQTSATTGTGAYTLIAAPTGFINFSQISGIVASDTINCVVTDTSGGFECGIYTYTSSTILTRTTITQSSNGGAAVSWGAGTKTIRLAANAQTNPVTLSGSAGPAEPHFDSAKIVKYLSVGDTNAINAWDTTGWAPIEIGGIAYIFSNNSTAAGGALWMGTNAYFDATNFRRMINDEVAQLKMDDGTLTFLNAGTGAAASTIAFTQRLQIALDGTSTFGSPGGTPGAGDGVINAKQVRDDGQTLTCFPLEFATTGDVSDSWAHHPLLPDFLAAIGAGEDPTDPKIYSEMWRRDGHLFGMPSIQSCRDGRWIDEGIGAMVTRLMQTVDLQAIHIAKLLARIEALEKGAP